MKIKITEEQLKTVVKEMAYPVSFNFDEFKNIQSFTKKIEYCNKHLQRIASGSARIAYKVDEEKVLKLAKNKKGIAQNEEEYNSYAIMTGIGANVFDCDDNFLWIEMELATKCKPSDFKRIIGYDFNFVQEFINYIASWYSRNKTYYDKRYLEEFEKIVNEEANNWEWFNGLSDYMSNTGLEVIGDLKRISSWGIVKRDGGEDIVLIDFGLNDDVYGTYYSKK